MIYRYHFIPPSKEERLLFEYLLLEHMEDQRWCSIVFLDLWHSEGLICIQ